MILMVRSLSRSPCCMDESPDGGSPSTIGLVLLLGEASSIKTLLLFLLY